MLAYVFWHWKRAEFAASEYENRQRAFHAALASASSSSFLGSFSAGISDLPWAAEGDGVYEDWYFVRDFAALGLLNESAVSASRSAPHDAAAAAAAGGTAGLYGLRRGTELHRPRYAHWFGKPDGMNYRELFARIEPVAEGAQGALWMRQMVLGPAREFCLHASVPVSLADEFNAFVVPLRPVWPESPGEGEEPGC